MDKLKEYLQGRIAKGVHNFCAALHKAFKHDAPEEIHVLLAGNASKSGLVKDFFGIGVQEEVVDGEHADHGKNNLFMMVSRYLTDLFGDNAPILIPHAPLEGSSTDFYEPTGKTGVALGLLDLCPGSLRPVKVVSHVCAQTGEAPFAHYVGRAREGMLLVGLPQGANYKEWHELGPQREGVFALLHTQSPHAHTGNMRIGVESTLKKKTIRLAGKIDGHKVFARAIAPDSIEICTAVSLQDAQDNKYDNLKELELKSSL